MSDPHLRQKVEATRAHARKKGLDLVHSPLLATFELPFGGSGVAGHEISSLARLPGTAVAVVSPDPLPVARGEIADAPQLHLIAERGLVCGLSGGAVLHVYPGTAQERLSFSAALFAGAAPGGTRLALGSHRSIGRQEVAFADSEAGAPATGRELFHAIRHRGGDASLSESGDVLVEDDPVCLEEVRAALSHELPGRYFRVTRLPSGTFRFEGVPAPRDVDHNAVLATAQGIAVSCDRLLEIHGDARFGFVTESVARWSEGAERGAQNLAEALFGLPDAIVTHLGQQIFVGDNSLFFAYGGSDAILEAEIRGAAYVTVRDIVEYARVLQEIRTGG